MGVVQLGFIFVLLVWCLQGDVQQAIATDWPILATAVHMDFCRQGLVCPIAELADEVVARECFDLEQVGILEQGGDGGSRQCLRRAA